MFVITDDILGMTDQEFADDYYDNALQEGQKYTSVSISIDGYLFLINLKDRTFHLSTCGSAINQFSDAKLREIFDEIKPYMSNGEFETALIKLLENTPY